MKKRILLAVLLAASLCGCVKEGFTAENNGPHTVRMSLRGGVQTFDQNEGTKAAAALTWSEGDRIYIRATDDYGIAKGVATCDAAGNWTFTYDGALAARNSSAECYFFQNATGSGPYNVSLSYDSVAYGDSSATLAVDADGNVTLSTYLKPLTGRICFHSSGAGDVSSIGFSGLSWYSSFEFSDFSFSSTAANVTDFTTGQNHYFYGFFADGSERKMIIRSDILYFSRVFPETVLRPGSSGYLDVPTVNGYDGWTVENPENLDAYIPIEFEDANFKGWLLQQFDSDGDGEISRLEGRNITSIDNQRSTDVSSLKGIEFFPNLEYLAWTGYESWETGEYEQAYGQLSSVDLSQNTALRYLYLRFNHLTSLDLSRNTALEELNVARNEFSSLDVSGCPALRRLDCSYNQLTRLSLTGQTSLYYLYCSYNQLTELNLQGCSNLRNLNFGNNQLQSVDLSSLTSLESLDCYYNPLSSLDLSACPKLRWLQAIGSPMTSLDLSGQTELTTVYVWDCGLTSLNIGACIKLTTLGCGGCELTSLDLTGLNSLQTLSCNGNQLSSLDLGGLTELREINCYSNQLTSLDVSGQAALEWLSCQDNKISSLTLQGNDALHYLDCSFNQLAVLNLGGCSQLNDLHGGNNPYTSLDLSSTPLLQHLWCENNQLTSLDLRMCPALTYLNTLGSSKLATIYVNAGHSFTEGQDVDSTTEIVYAE